MSAPVRRTQAERTAETRRRILDAVVESASGGTIHYIKKLTVFMVELDPAAYAAVAEPRRELFQGEYPRSTLVQVKALASPDWLIEIEACAVI